MDLKKTLFLCIICSASTSVSAQQNRARAYFKACLYFKDQWSQFHEELAHLPSHPLNLNSAVNKKVPKFQPCRYEKKKVGLCLFDKLFRLLLPSRHENIEVFHTFP